MRLSRVDLGAFSKMSLKFELETKVQKPNKFKIVSLDRF